MFRTVPLSIIRSFSLYTQQWYMSYRFDDSLRAGSGRNVLACSAAVWHIPLLCVQWKTDDDGERNCSKHVEFYSKNKFENLVHLLGFIIRGSIIRKRICLWFMFFVTSVPKSKHLYPRQEMTLKYFIAYNLFLQYILRPVQTVRAVPCFPFVLKAFMSFCLGNTAFVIFPTHLFPCRKEFSFIFLLCDCLLIFFIRLTSAHKNLISAVLQCISFVHEDVIFIVGKCKK